jgi:hypothetical protein
MTDASLIQKICSLVLRALYVIFPPLELWVAEKKIDRDGLLSDYEDQLESRIDEHGVDLEEAIASAEKAYDFELGRSDRFDSKAQSYLGNVGVVLSILSLIPVIALFIGPNGQSLVTGSRPERVVLILFGYSVLSLLLSGIYSSKALKIRGYSIYYTTNSIKNQLETKTNEDKLFDLLTCAKRNELNNNEKVNTVSVAESLTRNGLVALALGLAVILLENIWTAI